MYQIIISEIYGLPGYHKSPTAAHVRPGSSPSCQPPPLPPSTEVSRYIQFSQDNSLAGMKRRQLQCHIFRNAQNSLEVFGSIIVKNHKKNPAYGHFGFTSWSVLLQFELGLLSSAASARLWLLKAATPAQAWAPGQGCSCSSFWLVLLQL